jgi:hypothetical protein
MQSRVAAEARLTIRAAMPQQVGRMRSGRFSLDHATRLLIFSSM